LIQIGRAPRPRHERQAPQAVIARFNGPGDSILFDAVWDAEFRESLFRLMQDRHHADGKVGQLTGAAHESLRENIKSVLPKSEVLSGEQSNSSMLFEDKFFLKLYRKLEDGVNPDVEVTRFLTEHSRLQNLPALSREIEYRRAR
jgi:maltose alpha-D-glucosyltransferase/alpha-amylase